MSYKITLLTLATLLCTGCGSIDDTINDAVNSTVSGDVTTETIAAKDKVIIINGVNLAACAVIKNGLVINYNYINAETLVTELGVTCSTYGKISNSLECTEQDLAVWLQEDINQNITDFDSATGNKACVIGTDL